MTDVAAALDEAQRMIDAEQAEDARAQLANLVSELDRVPAAALERAAALCERLGLVLPAVGLLRRRLELEPHDHATWGRLATLHEELGDLERASRCRRRAHPPTPGADTLDAVSAHPLPHQDPPPLVDLSHDEADLARFQDLFAGREDCHARQWYDSNRDRGGYAPVPTPLSRAALRRHFDGRQTVGVYLLRSDATVMFCVFDVDATQSALGEASGGRERVTELATALDGVARGVRDRLTSLGLPSLLEDSGHKGRHVWLFFAEPVAAGTVLAFGRGILSGLAAPDPRVVIEFFPKQARASGKGLGNLVKLPLGIHRVSGRRAWLLNDDGVVEPRPFERLRAVQRIDPRRLPTPETTTSKPNTTPTTAPPQEAGDARRSPPVEEPVWTAEDFRLDGQVREVLAGCAVLQRLVERALARDPLDHDELVTLRHTLGHLDRGPAAVNFLLRRVPGVGAEQLLRRRLAGMPASCANLRRKLPGLARKVGCSCEFGPRLPTYPNPLLHLGNRHRFARLRLLEEDREPARLAPQASGPADP